MTTSEKVSETEAEASEIAGESNGQEADAQAIVKRFVVTSHGGYRTRLAIPGVGPFSVVMVSTSEITAQDVPFQGNAVCQVHNVVPENGGVRVRGFIDFGADIRVQLAVFVA
ncbi:hypothetical protein BST43_03385 [Mycobacteroides saopaulense]|uniref:Uncharacterized protein n=1 Tax=Mycobacteroides saopaulense TaxID=1578165 RepID=A0A1S4VT87_9MYCO|nr:hypothetical protein [Mycobacteroides saopaulense]ALR12634.1 hypothetical protein MYCSP_15845 [Mycobacteroides saopaulense]ORB60121.1 hypothetical protein BST43_03385 [Mycobacteroides saopaulense]